LTSSQQHIVGAIFHTPCIASLLPCDAMRKRGLCCRLVSVRPSVKLVHCIQMAEDIIKLLCRPSSPIILVSDPQHLYPIQRGTPSVGAQNTRSGKILWFSTEIAVYLGNSTR